MAEVTPLLVAAGVAVLAGSALQSATGFGFALVSAPLLFAALGPQEAIGTLLVLGTEIGLLIIAGEGRRPRPLARDATVIVAAAAPGALAGVAVLRSLDAVALQVAVTAGVIATLLARRVAAAREEQSVRPAWSAPAAGFAAGALSTSTNTSGPPLLLHLMGRGAEPGQVRDTLTVSFLGIGAVSAAALALTRTAGAVPDAGVLAATIPLVAIGNLVGRRFFRRLAGSGVYEPVLTGVLVLAVGTGLLTAVL